MTPQPWTTTAAPSGARQSPYAPSRGRGRWPVAGGGGRCDPHTPPVTCPNGAVPAGGPCALSSPRRQTATAAPRKKPSCFTPACTGRWTPPRPPQAALAAATGSSPREAHGTKKKNPGGGGGQQEREGSEAQETLASAPPPLLRKETLASPLHPRQAATGGAARRAQAAACSPHTLRGAIAWRPMARGVTPAYGTPRRPQPPSSPAPGRARRRGGRGGGREEKRHSGGGRGGRGRRHQSRQEIRI